MDIDMAHKAKAINDNCQRCGEPGHWAKDCKLRFDVCHMTVDELSALIEDWLAALDIAQSEPEEEVPADPHRATPTGTKDFVPHSK